MKPTCRLEVNGRIVDFRDRLQSVEITDKEGVSSDLIRVTIVNERQDFALPPKGALLVPVINDTSFGQYEAETVGAQCWPHVIEVTGKAAGFRGREKEVRQRNWDNATLAQVATDIANELGYAPILDPIIGSYAQDWWGQIDESNVAFLERLAKHHDAIFSIKNGNLILAAKGTGKAPSGAGLTPVILREADIIKGTLRFDFGDRSKYKDVAATYTDRGKGERVEVLEHSDEGGTARWRIGEQFGSESEAREAARATAKEMKRRQVTFSCEVWGDPTIRAGAPVQFPTALREVSGLSFIAATAVHAFGRDYRVRLDGHVKT